MVSARRELLFFIFERACFVRIFSLLIDETLHCSQLKSIIYTANVQQCADVISVWSLPTSSTCLKQFRYQGLLSQVGQSHDPDERAIT